MLCTGQNRIRVAVLVELGRIRQTWQNLVETADCGRGRQIAVDCGRLRSRNRSLTTKSVEIGRRV